MKIMKVTFSLQKFKTIASFTQIESFSCFFRKRLNNSVGFMTPVVKKFAFGLTTW